MDLTANAKLIPAVLRPKGSVIIYGTGPEATIPSFFCLSNSILLQFFLVYQLDADERERAVAGITQALEPASWSTASGRPSRWQRSPPRTKPSSAAPSATSSSRWVSRSPRCQTLRV